MSRQDVERFVALGEKGREHQKKGELLQAENAFRGQIAIFRGNADPFVSVALVAAQREDKKVALEEIRNAVVRGFTDLQRVERSEAWTSMKKNEEFLWLQDMVPQLLEIERAWGGWDAFIAGQAPPSVAQLLAGQERRRFAVEASAPAFGARLTRLWNRAIERSTAALLEAYVAQRPGAPDLRDALGRLMTIYGSGPAMRWASVPEVVAKRLGAVAKTTLEKFPESELRPGALVCSALARYTERDKKGVPTAEALASIRTSLAEVVEKFPDSPLALVAAEGLVRTEWAAGQPQRAAEVLSAYRDPQALRASLGVLALRVGGLPEFKAASLDGATLSNAELSGKVVVVDFWATWCKPCVEQMDTLRKIESKHGEKVVVLGVNLDRGDELEADALRAWIAHEKAPGRHIRDGEGWESEIVRAFGVKEIPFSVVVAADGRVTAVNEEGKALEKAVAGAMKE